MLFQDARDVVDIGSAIREILVRQAPEARREVGSRFGDRPLGIDFLMHDPALDRTEKGAVLQEQGVRLEDPGVLGAEALFHVPGRGLDLIGRGLGRSAEPLDLGLDLLRLESPLRPIGKSPAYSAPRLSFTCRAVDSISWAADSAARRNRSISGSISSGSRVLFGEESSRETQSTARPTATPGDTGIPVSES